MIEIIFFLGIAGMILYLLKDKRIPKKSEEIIQKEEDKDLPGSVFHKKDIEDILGKADRLLKAEAYKNAEKLYIEVITLNPRETRAYKGLSRIYIKQENIADAIASLEKVCELDPSDDTAFNNLGLMYFKNKDCFKAIGAYEKSLFLDKTKIHRYLNLALVLMEVRDMEKAAEVLEKSLKISPKKEALDILIDVYTKLGDEDKIKRTYKRLLENDPENKEAKRALAKEN